MSLSSTFSRQTAILVETKLFTFLVFNAVVWGGTLKFYNAGWYATRRIRALSVGGKFDDMHFDTICRHIGHTERDRRTDREMDRNPLSISCVVLIRKKTVKPVVSFFSLFVINYTL